MVTRIAVNAFLGVFAYSPFLHEGRRLHLVAGDASRPSFDMNEPPDPGFSEAAVTGATAVNRIATTVEIEA